MTSLSMAPPVSTAGRAGPGADPLRLAGAGRRAGAPAPAPAGSAGPAADAPASAGPAAGENAFAARMRRALADRPAGAAPPAAEDPRGAARTAAQQMVASLFVQPMLDMTLESRIREGGPFAPGQGEKTFGPLLNQRLADEIVRAADLSLVDAIVDRLVGPDANARADASDRRAANDDADARADAHVDAAPATTIATTRVEPRDG